MKNGREKWFLFHIEIQGYYDRFFKERMFKCFSRIFDRYQQPVAAIALFTGSRRSNMHQGYKYDFYGTHLRYRFNTLSILDYPDRVLAESDNPFALAMLVAKKAFVKGPEINLDERLLAQKISLARLLYSKGLFDKPKISIVLGFLNNYVIFKKPKMNSIFRSKIDQITGKKNTMGFFEQLAEIKAEEVRKEGEQKVQKNTQLIVKNLLTESGLSSEKIASIANVSLDFVNKVRKSLVSPKTN